MTTNVPWTTREAFEDAQRAALEAEQESADPQAPFRSLLHDRMAALVHARLPPGFDAALIESWATSTANAQFPAPAPAPAAVGDERAASLERQLQGLVQAMAGFSPPAAGQAGWPLDVHDNLPQVIAADWR